MKKIILIIVLIAIGSAIAYLDSLKPSRVSGGGASDIVIETNTMTKEEKSKQYDTAKEISTPDGFINTDGIAISDQIGKKVILVDFWTYSCINCQRTLPYLNAWHKKYSDKGLVIIGVHTPEFEFEKKIENVQKAVERFGIEYPVVLDNDFSTWNAYQNRYWPRKYLIDIDGFIVYDHIGEGGYDETERKIQELLEERMRRLDITEEIAQDITTPEGIEEVDFSKPRSPEIYFGAARNTYLGNGTSGAVGSETVTEPEGIKTNILYLVGTWRYEPEFAENRDGGAKIIFRYQAEKVFMVASSEKGATVQVLRDGTPIQSSAAGADVTDGKAFIREERLYRLIEDTEGYGEHTLEIIIEDPGVRAFTFTFG